MEQQMKELLDNREPSTSLQRDKQRLYRSVFEYTKTETWTCAWKLNPLEMSAYEATQHIFQKIFKCTQHPISQEILLNQNVFKRRLEKKLQEYSEYKHLPDVLTDGSLQGFHDMPHEYVINNGNPIIVSKPRVKSLNKFLESVSSEITNNIENVLEVFYLIYKSLLPEDSEELCYRLIEAHILEPLWPSFISLFRISNISSEYKISRTIKYSETCNARKFGVTKVFIEDIDKGFIQVCRECVIVLKKLPNHISLNEKLKILVEVCQAICGTSSPTSENQGKLGADDLMPLLCYVIVQSGMPQLGSECYAIEQLFNMKYSFGEEGYALSSFLTALKYIEFRVGVED
ncbi:hypothetical protein JTE90_025829 [Oedothorax gibbosus]|uniref:VPS9 domain-containing protein n=1 Tax=Oedothorax gibbosus TaxID=931172 RepID=A0AAV6UTW9_9ARAC|nr:hypothetical protein JTE90_025829 [Oedothorax gibbosus]